ncbi:hypothetical protein LTR17_025026 [Elasticomyces elasticus]|nr:hypothetical protein LTR17_025026 [Elasticomyces elasticus]
MLTLAVIQWIQMALWAVTAAGLYWGYRPPVRHTRLDHLSLFQKIKALDLVGFGLLSVSLSLFLTGLNLGGGLYGWTDSHVLGSLVSGIVVLISFFLFEWKGIKTGILHHGGKEQGRTFAICAALLFIEGIMLFSIIIFYPVLTVNLFETDPFLEVARGQPFWIACMFSTLVYGYVSTKRRSIRAPMFVGFVLFTAGLIGLATIEPGHSINAIVFNGLAGLGFGAPLVLIVAGVQLSTPHHLIATATAVTTSARAVAATVFTAIYSPALSTRLDKYIPAYVSEAALVAGLPPSSVPAFISALTGTDPAAVMQVPGVTPTIAAAGGAALKHAFADGIRVIYVIAVPFGALACIGVLCLGDLRKVMNYRVDAPVEDLRHHRQHERAQVAEAA